MNKQFLYTLLLISMSTVIICFYKKAPVVTNTTVIDSIKVKNDSICTIIKTHTEKIREIKTKYEEKIKSIDTLSTDSNCIIFSDFTSKDTLWFYCNN